MRSERIWELDAIRGFAILCVIVVHFLFDLTYFLDIDLQFGAVMHAVQSYGGTAFVILSGVCVTLGHRSFRRGLIVFGCGMLITAVTAAMYLTGLAESDILIKFGVLHLLGICMMLAPLLKKLPSPALLIGGIVVIVLGYVLATMRFSVGWLFPLGIVDAGFTSSDYFPLCPQLGWFCLGIVLGRKFYTARRSLFPHAPVDAWHIRFLRFCGRHSLWIYLLHQPILYGLTMLIG